MSDLIFAVIQVINQHGFRDQFTLKISREFDDTIQNFFKIHQSVWPVDFSPYFVFYCIDFQGNPICFLQTLFNTIPPDKRTICDHGDLYMVRLNQLNLPSEMDIQ